MYQHPVHQESISRKAVLCAPDSRSFFGTPCMFYRNIKTVKDIEAQSFLMDGFYGYSKYLKSFSIRLYANTRNP